MKFKYLSMALVAAFLLIGSTVSAQNRIYIEDAEYKAGENGLEILVLADHDFELAGVSIFVHLRHHKGARCNSRSYL